MLKSAILAVKKKNEVTSDIIYLTGKEDEKTANPQPQAKTRQVKEAKEAMPAYAKVEKTPSLKDTLNKIETIGKDVSINTKADTKDKGHADLPRESFTQEQLLERWALFVERVKKTDTRMFVALRSIEPVLLPDDKVELIFQNSAQIEEYRMRLRPTLLSELKEAFNNHHIELVEQLAESENMVKPNLLSDKEVLEKMLTKNPALDNLRKKFNLDFD